ncbi:YhgE/Pip domain-containing protein [Arthrobacter sp. H35-D1]|uniref:YhgE/Pip family protein n=1 Tax=Arthrobacter sp. H35-D1 TaxID=3046202 RepID=UPI0024B92C90|nr:YhgE/Pip domain-containing protein [Arthrobacter sp. H35-D1]MDJ0314255.1 YhgE/Pip domain-containing protein [Arthrobacter sp. H35-D1]
MFAFLSPGTELSRFKRGKLPKIAVAVMLFIPLIYGALYLWAFQAPDKHMDSLPVALVNADTGATNNGEVVNAGQDLSTKLLDGMDLKWEQTDAADATSGVADGKYYFSLTIPADFSKNAVSVGTDSPAQTQLDVEFNDTNNFLSSVLGKQAMAQVRDAVSEQLGEQTSSELLVGLHDAGDGLRAAADGSAEVTSGIDTAKDGAGQLVVGMKDLAAGSLTLKDGAVQLSDGAATLSTGVSSLAGGAATLDTGASSLSTGANTLATGLVDLNAGATALANGSSTLSTGSQDLATSLGNAVPDAQKLDKGAVSVSTGAGSLSASAAKLSGSAATLAGSADTLSSGAAQTSADLATLIATAENLPPETPASALLDSLKKLQAEGVQPLAAGAGQLAAGANSLSTDGTTPLAAGASQLADGVGEVSTGVTTLSSGVTAAATGADQLAKGAEALNSGAAALAKGSQGAVAGSANLAAGAEKVSGGASALSSGATTARDGAAALAAGAGTLSDGTSDLATGTGTLLDGGTALADGADKLSAGSHQLTTKLHDGGQTVPNDSAELLEQKSQVLANPVAVDAQWANESGSFGEGFAPFFIALATFVGALISWLLLRALPTRALAAGANGLRSVLTGLLPALAIGLGQVVIMVAVLLWGLDMNPVYPVAMAAFIYLTTVAFLALQQMLIIVFGTAAGRVASLVLLMLMLSSSGGTYPVETTPGFFQALHPFMPASYVVSGLRELMTGGIDSRLWVSVAFLALLALGSVAISAFAAGRQRVFSIKRLHPELEM